jgi:flavin-dependent dehydrogenase
MAEPSAMQHDIKSHYDVIIMGGGPAGSTLGALLAKRTNLKVAIFDREVFPREHIGESFAHVVIPAIEESGALAKVMASECYVMKYGGVFNWDEKGPCVALFDHANFLNDGVHRWSIHANRSEFDHILLKHARDVGVEVFEGVSVERYIPGKDDCVAVLGDGREVRARLFVDASGRQTSIATGKSRAWLSSYRNIAIWNHYLGCKRTDTLEGDWNVFREGNRSPIGCFAFENGWCWFIPVPKVIDGVRKVTHSIGIVTSPQVLKETGKDYTKSDVFFKQVSEVPMLKDLIKDAQPISDTMLTATNYSMVNDHFCNYEERWILVGDASYFVDPLFSHGVAFAGAQASAACLVIKGTLEGNYSERQKRDLWSDYDSGWHGMAETYALSIDQWYHAISKKNPGSIYWKMRGNSEELNVREDTFLFLLNAAVTPVVLQVMTRGTRKMEDLDAQGPFVRAQSVALHADPEDDTVVSLAPNVEVREALAIDIPGFKGLFPALASEVTETMKQGIAQYWVDPIKHSNVLPSPHVEPLRGHRFEFSGQPDGIYVRSVEERDGGFALYQVLKRGPWKMGALKREMTEPQSRLFKKLLVAKMVKVEPSVAAAAHPSAAAL